MGEVEVFTIRLNRSTADVTNCDILCFVTWENKISKKNFYVT